MTGSSIPDRVRRLFAGYLDPVTSEVDRGPRTIKRRPEDTDQVDEAGALLASLGGEVWAGDVVEIETSDPEFWNARSFTLSYRIECVCLAEVADAHGRFSFPIFFLAPDQGADVLILEGDLMQTARAYLGVRGPDALVDELRELRHEYRRSPEAQVTFDITTDGLGQWTAYAAREEGRFWWRHGQSDLVPHAARSDAGATYRDCSFYYGTRLGDATWTLRLLEIAGFGHAFQAEVLRLGQLKFWRRERPPRK
ncbi:MAG TPA: hypothetical protein VHN78_16070 [Chloroflexota bacterium]|nr:hypothetical protein [Chloroflexota bacterium]